MTFEQAFGQYLYVLRRQCSLTQEELALKVGLDYLRYCKIEQGKEEVTLKTLYLIAEALDIRASVLVAGAERLACSYLHTLTNT